MLMLIKIPFVTCSMKIKIDFIFNKLDKRTNFPCQNRHLKNFVTGGHNICWLSLAEGGGGTQEEETSDTASSLLDRGEMQCLSAMSAFR